MIRRFLTSRFSLHEDKADEAEIVDSIRRNVEFKGTNLWVLIFAIFIASIGLNVNSTAVIIGAMLISPIMGPIMGIGLGIGINDIGLIRKAAKNLAIAAVFSILASALYFWISPLKDAQSELLARTTPSIWDVFIALFGGLAGIVAATRKEKSNVIPGVAIATALMPPLCTAGFGLARMNMYYFVGAFYLFFINSVFICLSTYLIVRYLHFRKTEFEDPLIRKRVIRYIIGIVLLAALPSIYLAYRIVQKSIFEKNADIFIKTACIFPNSYVISRNFHYENNRREIDLLLVGEEVPEKKVDSLRQLLPVYHLQDVNLSIRQGLKIGRPLNLEELKASITQGLLQQQKTSESKAAVAEPVYPDLSKELKVLYPAMTAYSLMPSSVARLDTVAVDTVALMYCRMKGSFSLQEKAKLESWLQSRLQAKKVVVMVEKEIAF
jgi:uncharacterized hydrophobic protein (TIGR00271 family)